MIFIDRSKVSIPHSLEQKKSIGKIETAKAIKFFSTPRKKYRPFMGYRAYKSEDVKKAVRELFNDKCAYCESHFVNAYYGDVEHFRPKGEIGIWNSSKKVAPIRPGYYRLAADWNNLLFACKICNSINTQRLSDGSTKLIGKGNYFPLRGKKQHSNLKSSIKEEEDYRLLINPCIDNPEEYFKFDIRTGNILVKTRTPNKIDKAETSIEVYGLHRFELSKKRLLLIKRVQNHIRRIEEYICDIDCAISMPQKDKFTERLTREITELKSLCCPTKEYSAVVKQISDAVLNQYKK